MSIWTSQRFVNHPNSPAVSTTTEVPSGRVISRQENHLRIKTSSVNSRDTVFKIHKRMLERGKLDSLSPQQKRLLATWDFGTNFTVEHMTREPVAARHELRYDRLFQGKGTRHHFVGPLSIGVSDSVMSTLVRTNASWPVFGPTENSELFALGGTAIARTIPTKATTSLAQTLVELAREGVPSMLGSQLRREGLNTRSMAGEYLNYEFGWAPLVRDLISTLETVRDTSAILAELHAQSGEHTRRRYEFPDASFVDSFTGPNLWTGPTSDSYSYGTTIGARPQVVRTMKTKTWFSGAYTYYLPYGDDILSRIRLWEAEANRLLGMRITPELLWNVTSWTWLSDWFVSIGDVMTNISHIGSDGLTLHYGYIMRTTTLEAEVRLPGVRLRGSGVDISEKVTLTRKVRRRASPYGFGITPEALTAKQWSILAALGAVRAPGIGFNNINP